MRAAHLAAVGGISATLLLGCSGVEPVSTPATDAASGSGGSAGDSSIDGASGAAMGGTAGAAGEGGCDPAQQVLTTQCTECGKGAVDGACATLGKACSDEADCKSIIECMKLCKDQQCDSKCIVQFPKGTTKLFPYVACVDTTCHDECFCTGCRFGTKQSDCNPCLASGCLTPCNGCDKSTECMSLVYCVAYRCTDPEDTACPDNCGTEFDGGVTSYEALGTCGQDKCKVECGF